MKLYNRRNPDLFCRSGTQEKIKFTLTKRKAECPQFPSNSNTTYCAKPTKKLRIVHDRCNPFLVDKLFQIIVKFFPVMVLQNAALVSKRWRLFACNRLHHVLFKHKACSLSDGDLDDTVTSLSKIKDVVIQRLHNMSVLRNSRMKERFYNWRDNGQVKLFLSTTPKWAPLLKISGYPLQSYCSYSTEDVFRWIMENDFMDDSTKEHWTKLLIDSNIVEFIYNCKGS